MRLGLSDPHGNAGAWPHTRPSSDGPAMRRRFLWFRPRPDRHLPEELRPETVAARAEEIPEGVRDPAFERLVARIDTGPVHRGNHVRLFFDGEEAFDEVSRAVASAREEILLETYILRDDETGRRLLRELAAAAARGVKVRVLSDACGSWSTTDAFWRLMERRGVDARLFHPVTSHWKRCLFRDHRKIIVIDRRTAFTGGMNVANEYGSSFRKRTGAWRDTHMRLDGPAAREMALVFTEGWKRAGGNYSLISRLPPLTTGDARVLVLDSWPGRGQTETAAVLAAMAGAARRRLWITNAYFAPNRMAVRILARAASRGVDVRLLLPGWSDLPLIRHAGHANFASLLDGGVRIFEYQPAVLHAKTIVADDHVSVVGSSNLDFRSFYFNAECNLMIFDDGTGERMAAAFEQDLEHAVEIRAEAWKRRSLFHRLVDRAAWCLSPIL